MAYNIIRPRRGIKSLWNTYKSRIYKNGEMLVESPETGVGSGPVNIKFGDGITDYEHLPYGVMAPISAPDANSQAPLNTEAVMKAIEEYASVPDDVLVEGDVVNNLTSTSTKLPLSAAQGKALKDDIDKKIDVDKTWVNVRSANASNVEKSTVAGAMYQNNPMVGYMHDNASGTTVDSVGIMFDGTNFYATGNKAGADTVLKKLGSGEMLLKYYNQQIQSSADKTLINYTVEEDGTYRFAGTAVNTGSIQGTTNIVVQKNSSNVKTINIGATLGEANTLDYSFTCKKGDVIKLVSKASPSGYSYYRVTMMLTQKN